MRKEPEQDELVEQDGPEELFERFALTVDRGQEPLRLDKFLVARIENATRNKVQKAIESGRVLVNSKAVQPNYKIKPNDDIVVYSDKEIRGEEIVPENIPLNIPYEDDDVMIINKPAGMVVHPGCGNYTGTLINGLSWYLQQKTGNLSELPRVGLVHRIDKD